MLAILNSLNSHNLPIFQPFLMILVSKFMVHRALSDRTNLLIRLLFPLKHWPNIYASETVICCIYLLTLLSSANSVDPNQTALHCLFIKPLKHFSRRLIVIGALRAKLVLFEELA